MSLFNFTRQEQVTILFLTFALLVGGIVTLIKRRNPGFAPELMLTEQAETAVYDTLIDIETVPPDPSDSLLINKIDINQASEEELMALPGIGPKTAHFIVTFRSERGQFQTIEDLKGVKGIGHKTLEKLKPFIKIE